MRPLPLTVLALIAATPALAEAPSVLTDTGPVHSLVSMVMGDLGQPALIVPQGTSPHDASLTPSEAAALAEADLIVWTGPRFLPWLGEAIDALAPQAERLALLDASGWEMLPAREGADLHAQGEEDHAEDDQEQPAGGIDPHAWLDPAVASAWLAPIAEALAEADPANAAAYRANAASASARLDALGADVAARLAPFAGSGYAVGHDAYQYLERAGGLPANWAIAPSDASSPAPSAIDALRDAVVSGEVRCLLIDAETSPDWAATLGEGTDLRTAVVDPDGVFLAPGPDLYPTMIEGLVAALEGCLAP